MPNPRASTSRPRGYRVPGSELDMTVVDNAIRIGTPVSVDSEPEIDEVHTDHTRRIIREVEVPYERKVRVPVRTKRIVQDTQRVSVPVRRLREVPVTRTVQEKYTDFEEREAVRDKEIWVKQIVQEKYMKRVPVTRTRQKQVQEVELRPFTEQMEVEVPIDREEEEVGFRIDTVKDTKLVEVEEVEHYKLVPEKTDQREVVRTRELGAVRRRDGGAGHLERYIGESVYHQDEVESISTDSDPDDDYHRTAEAGRINTRGIGGRLQAGTRGIGGYTTTTRTRSLGGTRTRSLNATVGSSSGYYNHHQSSGTATRSIGGTATRSIGGTATRSSTRRLAPAGTRTRGAGEMASSSHMMQASSSSFATRSLGYGGLSARPMSRGADPFASSSARPSTANAGGILGIVLKNAERGGCRVVRVLDRSPAYAGGVKVNDVIVDVDSRQTNDLAEFRDAIVQSGGLIHLAVKRAGTVVTLRCTRKNFRG
eukprot:TRINITY_DN116_c0_g2_i1.p1 TRINITY_DN116_c0_g2~~TRINITY_DN116_c0_g2_i1.p1  ORF type:complete len:516 (-),score=170.37 TRINITY_DN116_c0_g2_i1:113-1555(-)